MHTVSLNVHHYLLIVIALVLAVGAVGCAQEKPEKKSDIEQKADNLHRFLVLDPGHFHAALVFKRPSYEGISPVVGIYAPVDEDYTDHMARVIPFNNRSEQPASWRYKTYLGPDYEEALFREKLGDIVILSGRNNAKIDNILECIRGGYNVLADKPWVIDPVKIPVLETALAEAEQKGIIVYDIMTERFEITTIVQQLLVRQKEVFGTVTEGTPDDPAVIKSSIHHLSKIVAGRQLKRPWWFFDTSVQGEGLVDITTHLVDIVFCTLHPEQAIDYKTDIEMVSAKRWPTVMTAAQYETITQKSEFPPQFTLDKDGKYPYYCNGSANFRLKGVNVKVEVIWNYQAPAGTGDTHYSVIKGTKAHVLVLQEKEQNFTPEVYLEPAPGADKTEVGDALKAFIASLASGPYPGLSVEEERNRFHIVIPQKYRVGHEAHFGQVTDRFLDFLGGETMPAWERPNMIAKYYVTTKALEMARQQ